MVNFNDNNQPQAPSVLSVREAYEACYTFYARNIGGNIAPEKTDLDILAKFDGPYLGAGIDKISSFFAENERLFVSIRGRRAEAPLFRHAVIFYLYVMASHYPVVLKSRWVYSDEALRKIFTDLGRSYDAVLTVDC